MQRHVDDSRNDDLRHSDSAPLLVGDEDEGQRTDEVALGGGGGSGMPTVQGHTTIANTGESQVSSYPSIAGKRTDKKSFFGRWSCDAASDPSGFLIDFCTGAQRNTFMGCCFLVMTIVVAVVVIYASGKHAAEEKDFLLSLEHGAVWADCAQLMDQAARDEWSPCNSLYEHTCGTLISKASGGSVGAFADMRAKIEASLEEISADGWPIIGNWFDGCMDLNERDKAGLAPLQDLALVIDSVHDGPTLTEALVQLHLAGVSALFNVYVAPDEVNMNVNSLYVDAAYGIPGAANSSELRAAIAAFIGEDATQNALWIEYTMLDPYIMSAADKRRFDLTYNPVDAAQAITSSGLIDWPVYLSGVLGTSDFPVWGNASRLVNVQPRYALQVDGLLMRVQQSGSWQELKSYLVYRMILTFYNDLPMGDLDVATDGDFLAQECLSSVESSLGDILGHYYVAKNFPASSKAIVSEIVNRTLEAFEARIIKLGWMDEPTKAEALRKLYNIRPMVGYPDDWDDDIPPYPISEKAHLQNVVYATAHATRANLGSLYLPPNPTHWLMTAYTVNAYYTDETIVLPAGILQGAFFHPYAPIEVNYGGIGMVIAHEEAHSLDDQGRMYNADGLRTDWWSNASATAFVERAQCVVNLYDSFVTPSGQHVDGQMTLGENLADLGGLNIAYDAYELAIAAAYPTKDLISAYEKAIRKVFGMTREQLFYRAYAYSWCSRMPQATADYLLKNDVHSPPRWRVDGASSQSESFASVFGCPAKPGACGVW